MGGDEFMAILDSDDVSGKTTAEKINVLLQIYKNCENKFITELNSFNKEGVLPVSIEIPYGMAEYNFATGTPEAAEKEASYKMNDSKLQMKNMKVRQSQMNS
jgi:GGDEF domain-containing protein